MFELFTFLKKEGDTLFWKQIAILATISGIANASLLSIINAAAALVEDEEIHYRYFLLYITLFIIFFMAKKNALKKVTKKIELIISDIRNRISDKLISSELSTIESLDTASVFVRLTKDANVISNITISLTNATQSIMMIFFALIYVLLISEVTFLAVLICISSGVLLYLSHSKKIRAELIETYKIEDEFFHSVDGILRGFKDLKLNSKKSKDFLDQHRVLLDKLIVLRSNTGDRFITNIMFSEVFLYILLASVVFIIPNFVAETHADVIKITATTLFIIAPLTMTVSLIPTISKASIAAKSLNDLEDTLDKEQKKLVQPIEKAEHIDRDFREIELKDLEFNYFDKDNTQLFGVGPVNLNIKKGELIFIVGGNGSGKSTFIKTLIGLYFPDKGSISIDNELIGGYNYQPYRDLFSIVLTDFYLFKKIYGIENVKHSHINKLLIEMQLEKKTEFIDGSYTNIDLSTGQRKRLALITSLIEDKPIYIFDEWAADQDPSFRKYFYIDILQTLKDAGKTIIAVTHDDSYFHMADRVFKMDYGKLTELNNLKKDSL